MLYFGKKVLKVGNGIIAPICKNVPEDKITPNDSFRVSVQFDARTRFEEAR